MSMDNYPCSADVVEIDFVKEMCPAEYTSFETILKIHNIKFDDFGHFNLAEDLEGELSDEHNEIATDEIIGAYEFLCQTFREVTGGLHLTIMWAEAMDRGDEVDGAFWSVDGVYGYTLAGEKYKDRIVKKSWNVFG